MTNKKYYNDTVPREERIDADHQAKQLARQIVNKFEQKKAEGKTVSDMERGNILAEEKEIVADFNRRIVQNDDLDAQQIQFLGNKEHNTIMAQFFNREGDPADEIVSSPTPDGVTDRAAHYDSHTKIGFGDLDFGGLMSPPNDAFDIPSSEESSSSEEFSSEDKSPKKEEPTSHKRKRDDDGDDDNSAGPSKRQVVQDVEEEIVADTDSLGEGSAKVIMQEEVLFPWSNPIEIFITDPWIFVFQDNIIIFVIFLVIYVIFLIMYYVKSKLLYLDYFTRVQLALKISGALPLIWAAFRLFYYLPDNPFDIPIMYMSGNMSDNKMSIDYILNPSQEGPNRNNPEQAGSNPTIEPTSAQVIPRTRPINTDYTVTMDDNVLKIKHNKHPWSWVLSEPVSEPFRRALTTYNTFQCIVEDSSTIYGRFNMPEDSPRLLNMIRDKTELVRNLRSEYDPKYTLDHLNMNIHVRNGLDISDSSRSSSNEELGWRRDNPVGFELIKETRVLRVLEGIHKVSNPTFTSRTSKLFFEDQGSKNV